MSNFGLKLAEILERTKTSQSELARATGILDSMISKWVNGQQKFVSAEDLAKLCLHISPVAKDRAELIKAHLQDELGAPGSELITINIKGQATQLSDAGPRYWTALPLKIQRALDILGQESITDADVRAMVLGFAGILDHEFESRPNSGPVQAVTEEIVGVLGEHVQTPPTPPLGAAKPTTYKAVRRSRKKRAP